MCTRICIRVYVHIYTYTHTNMCIFIHTYIYMLMYMDACVHIYNVYTYTCNSFRYKKSLRASNDQMHHALQDTITHWNRTSKEQMRSAWTPHSLLFTSHIFYIPWDTLFSPSHNRDSRRTTTSVPHYTSHTTATYTWHDCHTAQGTSHQRGDTQLCVIVCHAMGKCMHNTLDSHTTHPTQAT